MKITTKLPFPKRKLTGSLLLAASVALAQPALADDTDAIELDELEVTLEVFDDSEDLEAFELRLVAIDEDDDEARDEERDELAERMERFEEEVAAAGEDREEREDRIRDEREREAEEAEEEADKMASGKSSGDDDDLIVQ